jgi:phosphate acyltransferase
MNRRKIGIDLMGNENPPEILKAALRNHPLSKNADLVLFGAPEYQDDPHHYVATPEFIEMDESPLYALRRKKKASMSVGLRWLKANKIDAFISAGNTGAFVSSAKMILGNIPGILRPALLARMPTKKKPVTVLDVGANIQCTSTHLVQFAKMGAASCKILGIDNPTVGLLNIGSEPIKGTSELRLAYQALQNMPQSAFRFAGNIEGKSVFDGDVDVLVTDGFTGNIFLKTGEGIANLILDRFGEILSPGEYQGLTRKQPKTDSPSGFGIHPKIQDLASMLHYAEHPGALLVGVRGIVIKCHGYSTPAAFIKAAEGALELISV